MRFEGVAADGCMSWQADALLSVSLAKARVVHGVQRVVVDLNLPMSSITGKEESVAVRNTQKNIYFIFNNIGTRGGRVEICIVCIPLYKITKSSITIYSTNAVILHPLSALQYTNNI